MKRGSKIVFTIVFSLVFLLLVSCRGVPQGERPQDTSAVLRQVQTGTQGVEINTLPRYPPDTLYDRNELVALVEVRNRGNHNLEPQDCFIQMTGFDQNILGQQLTGSRSCAENVRTLEGKNVYNLEGGFNQIEFRSTNVQLPPGVYEYNPTLNILACYNYRTRANPQVCIDPSLYQITSEQKTCIPRDVSLGGGQGGPVGVSFVGVDMVGTKAIFEINVVNHGRGRIISPDAQIRDCDKGIDYPDLDKLRYNVDLPSASLVDCKPQDRYVRLVNNQGKIVCTFEAGSTGSYETPLLIDLDYGYISSYTKKIKVIQTPGSQ